MKLIHDQDIAHYIRIFLTGLLIFAGTAFLFFFIFHDTYDIHLTQNQFEYGSDVYLANHVDKIGHTEITKKMHLSENTIKTDNYEINFDNINSNKLGKQKIRVDFSDPDIKDTLIEIQIVDTKKPVIKIQKEQPIEMDLKQVEEKEFNDLFTLTDNHTPIEKMNISMKLNKDSIKPGDTVKLTIQAKDISGNKTSKTLRIHIREKKKKEEEPKKEDKEKEVDQSDQPSLQIYDSLPQQQENAPVPSQSLPPASPTRPSNKQFLFSDGYDMSTAPSACQTELLNSGRAGACTPLQDAEGIYYGMQLTYY